MPEDAGSSTISAARVVGRPFVKGKSGNPSGRPRASFDFSAAAREHTPEVLAMYLKSLRSNNWHERHSAAAALLDRALGKAPVAVTVDGTANVLHLHLLAAQLASDELQHELEARSIAVQSQPTTIDQLDPLIAPPPLE